MNYYKNPIIILNPKSAGGKSLKYFNKIDKMLRKNFQFESITLFETTSKMETIAKVQEIHENNENDLIITLGGDGSISTVCNGLMKIAFEKRLPILPVPTGSGNSLLLDFGIQKFNHSLENLKKNSVKFIDVLSVESISSDFKWYCVNILGLGFISDIVKYGDKNFGKMGAFRYILGTLLALKKFNPYKTEIKYNDGKNEFNSDKVYFISLSNTMYTAGKVKIAPNALFDDGLMDVVVLHDLNRYRYLKGFVKTFSGSHIHDKGCFYFKTREIEIYSKPDFFLMPDGELEGMSPVRVKVLPKQIKLVV